MSYPRLSKPHPHVDHPDNGIYTVPHTDMKVLVDKVDDEYPIALFNCEWWMTKRQAADLITTLTKALQETP